MNREIVMAAGAIPATMFVLANVGGSTAQMTGAHAPAITQSLTVTSVALLIAASATGSVAATVATGIAVAAVFYAMRNTWMVPGVDDFVPGRD